MKNDISQIKEANFGLLLIKQQIIQFIEKCVIGRNSQYVAIIKRENPKLYEFILQKYIAYSPAESLYRYLYNIENIPLCKHCNNNTKFISYKKGYARYCCKKCGDQSDKTKLKRAGTNLRKYGDSCAVQSKHGIKLRKKTCQKKYGTEHFSKSNEFKEKFTSTMKERYGCEYAMQSKDLKEKYRNSLENNYGVQHPSQSAVIYQNRNAAMKEKYGVEHAMHSDVLKEKHHKTLQNNYGVDVPLKSKNIHDKFKKTMKSRYGKEFTAEVDWLFEQMKQTNLEKYSVEYPLQNDEVKEKTKQTNLEKYGVEYPLQNTEIIKSIRLKMEQEGKWIPKCLLTETQLYYKEIIKITNKQPLKSLTNYHKRGRAGKKDAYHVDHKISIKYGFINNIPPYIVGNINNLEMLPWKDNIYKSSKCSIDLEDLLNKIFS